jgi:hypothetical protein
VIVVDASVALKWVLTEPDSDVAIALRNEELIAPDLWLAEAANGLWRHVRLREMTTAQALQFLRDLIDAPVTSMLGNLTSPPPCASRSSCGIRFTTASTWRWRCTKAPMW